MTDPTPRDTGAATADAVDTTVDAEARESFEESASENDALSEGDGQDDEGDDPAPTSASTTETATENAAETATGDGTRAGARAPKGGRAARTSPAQAARPDVSHLSYEEARDKLVETVSRLESGQADLETSVALWEMGEALAAHCTAALDRAEARLDRARADQG